MKLARLRAEVRNRSDVVLLARIVVLATFLPALLRTLRLPTLLRMLTPAPTHLASRMADTGKMLRFTDLILGHAPPSRKTCLLRALVLYRLLRVEGLPVRIHLGVRQAKGRLAGHSWLTCKGRPFAELAGDDSFTEIYAFPLDYDLVSGEDEREQTLCAWPG